MTTNTKQPDNESPNKPAAGGASVPSRYLDAVREVLDHLESSQMPAVEAAADLVVHALQNGGVPYCAEIGHGVQGDFIDRAGGLAALKAFTFKFNVENNVADCLKDRPRSETVEPDLEAIRLAVRTGNLRAGDVMFLGSVSGKNRHPVELALACRDAGVKVVGFTSLAYTAKVTSVHPSGKKLCDVADVVVDNGAPYGDAAVDIPGLDGKALPVSGSAMGVAGWLVWGRAMEKMAAAGDPPTVFMSLNRAGGTDAYQESVKTYQQRGY